LPLSADSSYFERKEVKAVKYETPEIVELGNADELILGCTCSACDCGGTKLSKAATVIPEE
jgi:hypothetical protein